MCNEKQTIKLTLEDSNGNKSTMEYSGSDIFAGDVINMFYSAMLGLTYQESSILDAMLDFAANKRNTQYVEIKPDNLDANPDEQYDCIDHCIDPHFRKSIVHNSDPIPTQTYYSVANDTFCTPSIKQ